MYAIVCCNQKGKVVGYLDPQKQVSKKKQAMKFDTKSKANKVATVMSATYRLLPDGRPYRVAITEV